MAPRGSWLAARGSRLAQPCCGADTALNDGEDALARDVRREGVGAAAVGAA
jgi:hypothetical protein